MARYPISAEGAASMRALAKQLYTEANAILEASTVLDERISAVSEGLGIYESEIRSIIQAGRTALYDNRNDIMELAQKVLQAADTIDELLGLNWGGAVAPAGPSGSAGGAASSPPGGGESMAPTRTVPRALLASQFGFNKDDDGNSVYDSPMGADKYLYASQGTAYSNITGTCGLCSCANVLRLAGVDVDEKQMIDHAMEQGECSFDKGDAAASGGTNPYNRQQILKSFGIDSHLETVQTDGGLATEQTMERIADNVSSGRGVIVSVDAGYFYKNAQYLGGGHAITVTSVKRSPSGEILGYYVCDSNQGTIFIDKKHLQRSLRATSMNVTDLIIR